MEKHDVSEFACPNPKCKVFGQRGLPSIRPHGWSSKFRGIRCLRCTVCGKDFSERRGTPFFRSQLPEEKIVEIVRHVTEGTGMRDGPSVQCEPEHGSPRCPAHREACAGFSR